MYCDKCGTNNVPEAAFCEKCGNRLQTEFGANGNNQQQAPETTSAPYTPPTSPASTTSTAGAYVSGGSSPILPLIIGVIIIGLVGWGIWALINNFVCGGGYKTPVNLLVEAIEEKDTDTLFEGMPDEYVKIIKANSYGESYYESLLKTLEDELDGEKLKYKIKEKKHLSKEKREDLEDDINETLEMGANSTGVKHKDLEIDDAYKLDVELKWGKDDADVDITVFKVDGKWYSLYECLDEDMLK